jgi:hypothetical protein
MAFKVLGQANPAATTDTTLYTVPAGKLVVVQSLTICNQSATAGLVRVAIRPDGAAIAAQHYVLFDIPWDGNWTDFLTIGMTMDAADVVTVRATTANFSFNLFGDESP